jgi:hypothetical protein
LKKPLQVREDYSGLAPDALITFAHFIPFAWARERTMQRCKQCACRAGPGAVFDVQQSRIARSPRSNFPETLLALDDRRKAVGRATPPERSTLLPATQGILKHRLGGFAGHFEAALEQLDAGFVERFQSGEIIVAGTNFSINSS